MKKILQCSFYYKNKAAIEKPTIKIKITEVKNLLREVASVFYLITEVKNLLREVASVFYLI